MWIWRRWINNIINKIGSFSSKIGAILLLGDDLLEWLFCDDMALIWIVLLILLLTNFGFDGGCC
jgi:hypothetical protein